MTLDLEFTSNEGLLLPDYLQGRQRFVLSINITPENDTPSIRIPSDYNLLVAQVKYLVLLY